MFLISLFWLFFFQCNVILLVTFHPEYRTASRDWTKDLKIKKTIFAKNRSSLGHIYYKKVPPPHTPLNVCIDVNMKNQNLFQQIPAHTSTTVRTCTSSVAANSSWPVSFEKVLPGRTTSTGTRTGSSSTTRRSSTSRIFRGEFFFPPGPIDFL